MARFRWIQASNAVFLADDTEIFDIKVPEAKVGLVYTETVLHLLLSSLHRWNENELCLSICVQSVRCCGLSDLWQEIYGVREDASNGGFGIYHSGPAAAFCQRQEGREHAYDRLGVYL